MDYINARGVTLRASANPVNWVANSNAKETQNGTARNDQFQGAGGDTMIGGLGDDTYTMWDNTSLAIEKPGEGVDTIISYAGATSILPDNVENLVLMANGPSFGLGNALDNIITASAKGSMLDGGAGNDVLVGGAGADVFRIRSGFGSDTIVGFTAGSDKLRLQGTGITSLAQFRAASTQVGSDVQVTIGGGETVVLRNVTLGSIGATDLQLSVDTSTMKLTFADEFNTLNTRSSGGTWLTNYGLGKPDYDYGMPGESEVYVDPSYKGTSSTALGINPFSVSADGILSITAAPVTAAAKPYLGSATYTSGVLTSKGSFSQEYGYFEIRGALPEGQGFWPAFWLMPAAGGWPPEIDIMESVGKEANAIYATTHDTVNGKTVANGTSTYIDTPTAMHTYGLNWTKDAMIWYIDGTEVSRQATTASFNQEFYINLNLAMGGSWAGAPDATTGTGSLKIDYVRVYANSDTVSQTVNGVTTKFSGGSPIATAQPAVVPKAFYGSAAAETVRGDANANILYAYAGNDTLDGGAGADAMYGGQGNDIYMVDNVGDTAIELADEGTDTVYSSVSFTLGDNVENLNLSGSAAINGYGNALANVITGNAASNTLYGYDGNDSLYGGAGADRLFGGSGNDIYMVDDAGDQVIELANEGNDTVYSSISFTLADNVENLNLSGSAAINGYGNALANVIAGNAASNTLYGYDGNDSLNGGAGADRMFGGQGNDVYIVDQTNDQVIELANEGLDTVYSSASFTLADNVENLNLSGSGAINGTGNAMANVIFGNTGNNVITGGGGNDTLCGGGGSDTFCFAPGAGRDSVTDFNSRDDYIRFSGINAASLTFTQQGTSTLISYGSGDVLTLLNTVATDPLMRQHILT